MPENYDDSDPSNPTHRDFSRWVMLNLEDALTPEAFYLALSNAITKAHSLDVDVLARVAALAATPWRRPRGRPANTEFTSWIFLNYIFMPNKTGHQIPRSAAVADIVRVKAAEGKSIEPDAVGKAYDLARRCGLSGRRKGK